MAHSLLTRLDARDRALFLRLALHDATGASARRFWRGVTHLGGATFTVAVSLAPLALGGAWQAGATRALVILVVSHLLVQLVKRTVGRPRPSRGTRCAELIHAPDRFSFPSGHAAAAMSVALGHGAVHPVLSPLLASLAVVVGFSRVALAVHYPGDVVVGQLLAVATALLLPLS